MIYVLADDNNLYAVNDSNGNIEWKWEVGSSPSAAPMIFDNHLLIPSSSGISSLHLAFEYKDLKVSWTRNDIGKVTTMPCTDGINIFFGTDSGSLIVLIRKWQPGPIQAEKVTCSPVAIALFLGVRMATSLSWTLKMVNLLKRLPWEPFQRHSRWLFGTE